MVNLENGVIKLDQLEMSDIIDINKLQAFLDNFALGMNCAAVSVDRDGNEVTKPSYYRPFCSNFIHRSTIGDARCAKCHNQFGEEAVKKGKPFVGTCHAGMIDFAAPVIVEGEHIGTILGGQILDKEPDDKMIRRVAGEIGVNPDELSNASKQIDIVSRKNIEAAAEVLNTVVNQFAQSGYNKLQIEIVIKDLMENLNQISATIGELAESAQTITENQKSLSEEILDIENAVREIEGIVTLISGTADKTNLIGLNASIEAARLGNDGMAFAIVAREIRNLAVNTKKTSSQITQLNEKISGKVNSTSSKSDESLEATQNQSAAMQQLSATVTTMLTYAERLNSLFS